MSEIKHTPLTVGQDSEDECCLSVWTDVPGAANAEVAGSIGDEHYAQMFAAAPDTLAERDKLRKINAELLEALETVLQQLQVWAWEPSLNYEHGLKCPVCGGDTPDGNAESIAHDSDCELAFALQESEAATTHAKEG